MTLTYGALNDLNTNLEQCRQCSRLVEWRQHIGQVKRAAYYTQTYWARPVPGFGDIKARVLILGLAPGAHGSNRTGRMFTGDASGNFLFPALYRAGFSTQPTSIQQDDGLKLSDAYITAAARCAPPNNKLTTAELQNCYSWLEEELKFLPNLKVILALGKVAHEVWLQISGLKKSAFIFTHGAEYEMPNGKILLDSYHVSQQNTQTGRLTAEMFDVVLKRVRTLAG